MPQGLPISRALWKFFFRLQVRLSDRSVHHDEVILRAWFRCTKVVVRGEKLSAVLTLTIHEGAKRSRGIIVRGELRRKSMENLSIFTSVSRVSLDKTSCKSGS